MLELHGEGILAAVFLEVGVTILRSENLTTTRV